MTKAEIIAYYMGVYAAYRNLVTWRDGQLVCCLTVQRPWAEVAEEIDALSRLAIEEGRIIEEISFF